MKWLRFMAEQNRASTDDSHKSFEQLARELECDEDEARFEESVKRIAPKSPEKDDRRD